MPNRDRPSEPARWQRSASTRRPGVAAAGREDTIGCRISQDLGELDILTQRGQLLELSGQLST